MHQDTYKVQDNVKEEVIAKAKELLELCQIYKIPMFTSLALENNEDTTIYFNTMFGAKVHGIELKDDQIQRHILIANGFHAVPPREELVLDFSLGEKI